MQLTIVFARWSAIVSLFCVILATSFSCKDDTIQPPPTTVPVLSLLDNNCTEAWINVKASLLPATSGINTLSVRRGNRLLLSLPLPHLDTVLYVDSLLPNRSYQLRSERQYNGISFTDSSEHLTFTTLDTTSHAFSWQIDTLGDGNYSTFNDVEVLNDSTVYAVGEIYFRDSLGQFNTDPFNFAKWNGHDWQLKSITYVPLRAVYAFNDSDIWAGSSAPYHWNGLQWKVYNVTGLFNGYINKFWGRSSSDLFMVGTNGAVAHFDGYTWTKVESGTTASIGDAWGIRNSATNGYDIYCPVTDFLGSTGVKEILKITNGTQVDTIPWGTRREVTSLWGSGPVPCLYASGDGLFKNPTGRRWQEIPLGQRFWFNSVRGNSFNDITAVDPLGFVAHFNGFSWQVISVVSGGAGFSSVAVKTNLVVAVGSTNARAIVAIGRR